MADGHPSKELDVVYKLDVIRNRGESLVKLVRPRPRTLKVIPNSMDVVKRAVASVKEESTIDAVLSTSRLSRSP